MDVDDGGDDWGAHGQDMMETTAMPMTMAAFTL